MRFFNNIISFRQRKKQKILFVIKPDLSAKSAIDISLILMKYKWSIELAIDELVKEDENEGKPLKENIEERSDNEI